MVQMRRTIQFLLIASVLPLTSCDPAIRVYQVKLARPEGNSVPTQTEISVRVKQVRQLIGESLYEPEVIITNSSGFEVKVSSLELVTEKTRYTYEPRREKSYPLLIRPGTTADLHGHFELKEGILKTFSKPAEFLVHYRVGQRDKIEKVRLVSGSEKEWIQ